MKTTLFIRNSGLSSPVSGPVLLHPLHVPQHLLAHPATEQFRPLLHFLSVEHTPGVSLDDYNLQCRSKNTLNNFPLLLSWVAVPEVLEERLQLLKGEVGEVYSTVLGLLTQDPLLPADQQTVRLRVALEHVPAKMFSV